MTVAHALKKAKRSIYIVTFGLSDPTIIKTLQKKANENIDMKVFYDKRSSPYINLVNKQAYPLITKGLIHQKIIVIDNSLVFLGSANMTKSSLSMQDNLLVAFHSSEIANFLIQHSPFYFGHCRSQVGCQDIELWLLPDSENKALFRLINLINSAQKSINIAMFTLTHPLLINEIIKANQRGVKVKIFIDHYCAYGASKKTIEKLKKTPIEVYLSSNFQLFHHKHIYIDKKILICGSTNWTQAAFQKNADCFIILHDLLLPQKRFMNKLQRIIQLESRSIS